MTMVNSGPERVKLMNFFIASNLKIHLQYMAKVLHALALTMCQMQNASIYIHLSFKFKKHEHLKIQS